MLSLVCLMALLCVCTEAGSPMHVLLKENGEDQVTTGTLDVLLEENGEDQVTTGTLDVLLKENGEDQVTTGTLDVLLEENGEDQVTTGTSEAWNTPKAEGPRSSIRFSSEESTTSEHKAATPPTLLSLISTDSVKPSVETGLINRMSKYERDPENQCPFVNMLHIRFLSRFCGECATIFVDTPYMYGQCRKDCFTTEVFERCLAISNVANPDDYFERMDLLNYGLSLY